MEHTLRENAKYVFSSSASQLQDPDGSSSHSLCEVKCQQQQAALVDCMNSLRQEADQSRPTSSDVVVTKEHGQMNKSCLSSSVAAWTECCSKANLHDE